MIAWLSYVVILLSIFCNMLTISITWQSWIHKYMCSVVLMNERKISFYFQPKVATGYPGGVPFQSDTGTYKGRGKRSLSEGDESNQAFFAGAEEMAASIESIKKEIEEIRRPSGTQANPARSCKDLYLCNKGKEDGRCLKCSRNTFIGRRHFKLSLRKGLYV